MIKIRSICQAVIEIKQNDTNTAMTETLLKKLIKQGDVSSANSGCRILLDMEKLCQEISDYFELEASDMPKLRTIRGAVDEIRKIDSHSEITEYQIRLWLKENRLHSMAVGSRQIVALEEFDDSRFLKTSLSKERNNTQSQKITNQFGNLLSKSTQGFTCQRKR